MVVMYGASLGPAEGSDDGGSVRSLPGPAAAGFVVALDDGAGSAGRANQPVGSAGASAGSGAGVEAFESGFGFAGPADTGGRRSRVAPGASARRSAGTLGVCGGSGPRLGADEGPEPGLGAEEGAEPGLEPPTGAGPIADTEPVTGPEVDATPVAEPGPEAAPGKGVTAGSTPPGLEVAADSGPAAGGSCRPPSAASGRHAVQGVKPSSRASSYVSSS